MNQRSGLRALLAGAAFGLVGCGRSPSFNVLGSYFPGWIAAIVAAVLLTALLRLGARHTGLEHHIPMLPLFYASLAVLFACVLWLVSFD